MSLVRPSPAILSTAVIPSLWLGLVLLVLLAATRLSSENQAYPASLTLGQIEKGHNLNFSPLIPSTGITA